MKRLANEPVSLSTTDALRRLAKGPDDCAWTTVLDRHGVEILRATQRILGDPMSAEDACQETLLQIRDRAAQFRGRPGAPDATARNWIMRIACNTALHMLRQRRRSRLRELNVAREAPQTIDAPDLNGGANEELAERVHAELAELPEKQRLPLMLHFFAGLDYEQISAELRCGAGAARVRVHRALEKLRERMAVVGVLLTTAALYALLTPSRAAAGEVLLDPQRYARFHGLLLSSQQAAINVVSDPSFTAVSKIGYAVASAAIAGTMAFSWSHPAPEKPLAPPEPNAVQTRVTAVDTEEVQKQLPQAERQPPPAPPFQGGENGLAARPTEGDRALQDGRSGRDAAKTERAASNTGSAKTSELAAVQPPRRPVPHEKNESGRSLTAAPAVPSAMKSADSKRAASAAREAQAAAEKSDAELVSRLTQLEMLRVMQHELNVRVARIHDEINVHGVMTVDDELRLRHAADDQAEVANLLRRVADELQFAQTIDVKQAGLDK